MSMLINEFKALENQLVNDVLYFALGPQYSDHVDRAKDLYEKILKESNYFYDEKNFVSWLLWDYKLENGNNFFQEYIKIKGNKLTKEEIKIIEEISNTYLSIYENTLADGHRKLIDIFSKKEIIVKEEKEMRSLKDLIIGRIVNYHGENYMLDDYLTLNQRFQNGIEKTFREKFEDYRNKNKFCTIEEFLKDNSILLYSFAHIIEDISKKQMESDVEYNVFQSNYVVLDYKGIYDSLMKAPDIELDYEDRGILYFIMYKKDRERVLSEIVLLKNKLELECISSRDNEDAKRVIERLLNTLIKHVSDEILTMDDIL